MAGLLGIAKPASWPVAGLAQIVWQMVWPIVSLGGSLAVASENAVSEEQSRPAPGQPAVYERRAPPAPEPAANVPPEMKLVAGGAVRVGIDKETIQKLNLESESTIGYLATAYPVTTDRTLEPFFMDVREVTNAQWKIYLDATKQNPGKLLIVNYWKDGKIPKGHESHPVVLVSLDEAKAYARWALKRIPTEFEWEQAARSTDGRLYPWGPTFDDAGGRGGARSNCGESSGKREATAVGTLPAGASPFGILDLAGNVWEWTTSPFVPYDPKQTVLELPGKGEKKKKFDAIKYFVPEKFVIRGGAFDSNRIAMLSAVRQGENVDCRFNTIGVRCVRDVRPGVELVRNAVAEIGAYAFSTAPIGYDTVQASERVRYDANGYVASVSFFAVGGAKEIQRSGKNTALSLADVRKDATAKPLPVGVITTSSPLIEPALPAGSYAIALFCKDSKKAEAQKKLVFPESGWNTSAPVTADAATQAARDAKEAKEAKTAKPEKPTSKSGADPKKPAKPDAKPEPDPKSAKGGAGDKSKPADAKGGGKTDKPDKTGKSGKGGKAGEPPAEPPADPPADAPEGGEGEEADAGEAEEEAPAINELEPLGPVTVDRSRDALVLLDTRGAIVAALPLATELKEATASAGLSAEPAVPADASKATPGVESVTYRFRLWCGGRKTFDLAMPLKHEALVTAPSPAVAKPDGK